ncbi:hypothetical protein J6590_050818 [Homalodisca vitripennis]|nr:hypothetical protein J6590_050818 [Homalodisca vitripennis]
MGIPVTKNSPRHRLLSEPIICRGINPNQSITDCIPGRSVQQELIYGLSVFLLFALAGEKV